MTLVIALRDKKRILLCADKRGSDSEDEGGDFVRPKIFKVGGIHIGFAGSYRMGQLLEFNLHPPSFDGLLEPIEDYLCKRLIPAMRKMFQDHEFALEEPGQSEEGPSFLVILENRIFEVMADFAVIEAVEGFNALGVGAYHAKVSLETTKGLRLPAERRVELAMGSVAKFLGGVGSKTDLIIV